MAAVLIGVLCVSGMGWMWTSSTTAQEDMGLALETALRDSTRFADIIQRSDLLQARSDSVIQRVNIIQEIDEGRYVWPHVLDEVARALPDYTWLDEVMEIGQNGSEVDVRVGGKAGNNFALAVFMDQLESSPFFRNVHFTQSEQTVEVDAGRQVVYTFAVEATYASPELDFLQTVPLFGSGAAPDERVGLLGAGN
jgi:Tfp pilus assembly protein PilN